MSLGNLDRGPDQDRRFNNWLALFCLQRHQFKVAVSTTQAALRFVEGAKQNQGRGHASFPTPKYAFDGLSFALSNLQIASIFDAFTSLLFHVKYGDETSVLKACHSYDCF